MEHTEADAEVKKVPNAHSSGPEDGDGKRPQKDGDPAKNKRDPYKTIELWILVIQAAGTIAIVLLTGIYACYSRRQWQAMTEANQRTDKVLAKSDISLKTAADALDETKKQNAAARDALRLEQRAWVGVVGVAGTPVAGQPIEVSVAFSNNGRTPAMDVRTMVNVVVVPIGAVPPIDYAHPHFPKGQELRRTILPPNVVTTLHGTTFDKFDNVVPLTEAHVKEITDGRWSIYARGRLEYRDIFEVKHWQTFCYEWERLSHAYTTCKHGNDADKEQP